MFENINVQLVAIHEIFQRGANREIVEPRLSDDPITLDLEASAALRDRLIKALGESSRCMEMDFQPEVAGCAIGLAKELVNEKEGFAVRSKAVAEKLAVAQTRQNLPGGIVVVLSGTAGIPSKRFICMLKAEPHNGFARTVIDGVISLQFLKDLILTPQTRLYKIGCFVEVKRDAQPDAPVGECWRAFIYDETMSATNKLSAASYFYDAFLGLRFQQNSATRTKEFYDYTKDFVTRLDVAPEQKNDLLNALSTCLKVAKSPTIQVSEFAQTYLADPEVVDSYQVYMSDKKFPANAVNKDLAYVQGSLKLRKLVFSQGIKITGPSEQFSEKVQVESFEGDLDENGSPQVWTRVVIKSDIKSQE